MLDDGPKFLLVKENGKKTGELVFRDAPDHGAPADGNGDNVYEFTITAVSGTGDRRETATVNVEVTVVAETAEPLPTPETPTPPDAPGVHNVTMSANTSPGAEGYYVAGNALTITVTFDADIQVTGTPQFKLQVGGLEQDRA